uniref:Uncharacterized protein n=1 Tax=Cucumis melo TaxID=3656 RepID=A0A9I9E8N9_CUCME
MAFFPVVSKDYKGKEEVEMNSNSVGFKFLGDGARKPLKLCKERVKERRNEILEGDRETAEKRN